MAAVSTPLRRTIGLCLLAATVLLWTASSFLASALFADSTYTKPYFVIYVNTAFFILALVPFFARQSYSKLKRGAGAGSSSARSSPRYTPIRPSSSSSSEGVPPRYDGLGRGMTGGGGVGVGGAAGLAEEGDSYDHLDNRGLGTELSRHGSLDSLNARCNDNDNEAVTDPLTVRETFILSAKFSVLWFLSNYFNSASLAYTSVASVTILSSTSSVFILVFGALFRIEQFTLRKLLGVLAGLVGVAIISKVDADVENDANRGSFPYKTPGEIAIGDAMALFTAVLYGMFAIGMVKTVGDESRVRMPLFMGFIGLFNTIFLWPVFAILHWTGSETFELPPNGHVWMIILINALASFVGDMTWAYSMLYLSPLVVTVGLSLGIPLSLLGQIALNSHWVSPLYFVGAVIVILSFIFINHESNVDAQRPVPQLTRG